MSSHIRNVLRLKGFFLLSLFSLNGFIEASQDVALDYTKNYNHSSGTFKRLRDSEKNGEFKQPEACHISILPLEILSGILCDAVQLSPATQKNQPHHHLKNSL